MEQAVPGIPSLGWRRLFGGLAAAALVCVGAAPATAAAASPSATTLYVAVDGSDAADCSAQAPCATIQHAVSVSQPGDSVEVGAGTYAGQVTVQQTVRLLANGAVTIDANGQNNGILVEGAGAASSLVRGFRVVGANEEGILLEATSNVVVQDNVVAGNDQGMFSKTPQGECAPQGPVPGDCGEGIHLNGCHWIHDPRQPCDRERGGHPAHRRSRSDSAQRDRGQLRC